jgi:hypothetical protein
MRDGGGQLMSHSRWAVFHVVIAAGLACIGTAARANVVHVPSDQPTIAAGIAAASPGDTVLLASNTYYEHGLSITKQITLAGYYAGSLTVTIDGQDSGRVLDVSHADGVVLSDMEFKNGTSEYGGGVRVWESDVVLQDCAFTSSNSTTEGGGLACYQCDVQATNCAFLGNTAAEGSAGAVLYNVTGLFYNCAFSGNAANWGGGVSIYNSDSTVTFDHCTFTSNSATGAESYGAGAYCYMEAAPNFTHCSFMGNSSDYCGGGICLDSAVAATIEDCDFDGNSAVFGGGFYVWMCGAGGFENCTFENNQADTTGGGGLLDNAGGVAVTGCTFASNWSYFGGGLGVYETTGGPVDCTFFENTAFMGAAVAYADCITAWATGCTMVRNEVQGYMSAGAGVGVAGPFDVALDRCVIAFSQAGEAGACGFGGTITASACDVHGNDGGDWVGCLAGQESSSYNTDADPLLCDAVSGDLTLCSDSPCLPANNVPAVRIGAHDQGCPACGSAVESTSWGVLKARYR